MLVIKRMVEEGEATAAEILRLIGGEHPEFVAQVRKMNDHYDWQRRYIVLTATQFYNIKRNWLGHWSVQRAFEIDHIHGVVMHKTESKFLIKISPQVGGDYLYDSESGDPLVKTLQGLRHHIRLWVVDADLDTFRRMKKRPAKVDVEATVPVESYASTQNSSKVLL